VKIAMSAAAQNLTSFFMAQTKTGPLSEKSRFAWLVAVHSQPCDRRAMTGDGCGIGFGRNARECTIFSRFFPEKQ
jgi:hypothetical protein